MYVYRTRAVGDVCVAGGWLSENYDYGGCVASIERVWDAEVRYTDTIEVYEHYS